MINKPLLVFLTFLFCANFSLNAQKVIHILPLGNVSNDITKVIENAVLKFYGYKCVVKPKVPYTKDILADSKTRYEASRILAKYKSKENLLIITDKDIAFKKGDIKEYGIFGLGYRPGSTCVISTFRIKKNVSLNVFNERLKKICLHEIGHNLGLNHCTSGNSKCMMNDAKGTIKQVDREEIYFCNTCSQILGK
jgi:archaemetzincin